ncbi:MAG TPA: hypothetical protein VFZ48_05135 [Candidatus Saccharimonadales bacterium]
MDSGENGLYIAYDAKSVTAAAADPKAKKKIVGYGLDAEEVGFLYFPNGKSMTLYADLGAATDKLPKVAFEPTDVDLPDRAENVVREELNVVLYMATHSARRPDAEKAVRKMRLEESVRAISEGHDSLNAALVAQAWPRVRPLLQAAFRGLDAWDRARAAQTSDKLATEAGLEFEPLAKRKFGFGKKR